MSRNRSAEAIAAGRKLCAFEISAEADQLIDSAARYLSVQTQAERGRDATRLHALEWLVREGVKKIPKKFLKST